MKSIGNGWKRAQEARIRAAKVQAAIEELERDSARFWANYRQPSTTPFQPIDAPLSQNVYPAHYAFSENLESTNWTTWQRIKRALRTL